MFATLFRCCKTGGNSLQGEFPPEVSINDVLTASVYTHIVNLAVLETIGRAGWEVDRATIVVFGVAHMLLDNRAIIEFTDVNIFDPHPRAAQRFEERSGSFSTLHVP